MNLPCPCCGFLTIDEDKYGSYNICSICGWEDDPVQLANPCSGGANRPLCEEQIKFKTAQFKNKDTKRDTQWRPLTTDEIAHFQIAKKEQRSFEPIFDLHNVYWMKNVPETK